MSFFKHISVFGALFLFGTFAAFFALLGFVFANTYISRDLEWETLLAGFLGLGGGAIALIAVNRQIAETRRQRLEDKQGEIQDVLQAARIDITLGKRDLEDAMAIFKQIWIATENNKKMVAGPESPILAKSAPFLEMSQYCFQNGHKLMPYGDTGKWAIESARIIFHCKSTIRAMLYFETIDRSKALDVHKIVTDLMEELEVIERRYYQVS